MNKTKIEWCDSTWNPVTGCLHGCEYCYARRVAKRFEGCDTPSTFNTYGQAKWKCVNPGEGRENAIFDISADRPPVNVRFDKEKQKRIVSVAPYPFGFSPTLHRRLLDVPQRWKKPRTIFVCSMADLFGDWVPDEWIEEVFAACEKAPQHRYLFLTKNPQRYIRLFGDRKLPKRDNMWYGTTVTSPTETFVWASTHHTFLSIEPILEDFAGRFETDRNEFVQWVIVGAETGNRKDKVIPEKSWIDAIKNACDENNISLFMKDSLIPIVGEENMLRELPWDSKTRKPLSGLGK